MSASISLSLLRERRVRLLVAGGLVMIVTLAAFAPHHERALFVDEGGAPKAFGAIALPPPVVGTLKRFGWIRPDAFARSFTPTIDSAPFGRTSRLAGAEPVAIADEFIAAVSPIAVLPLAAEPRALAGVDDGRSFRIGSPGLPATAAGGVARTGAMPVGGGGGGTPAAEPTPVTAVTPTPVPEPSATPTPVAAPTPLPTAIPSLLPTPVASPAPIAEPTPPVTIPTASPVVALPESPPTVAPVPVAIPVATPPASADPVLLPLPVALPNPFPAPDPLPLPADAPAPVLPIDIPDTLPAPAPADGPEPIAAVPEPATWVTMILGFGLVGAGLRRSATRISAVRVGRRSALPS